MCYFYNEESLKNHESKCSEVNKSRITLPHRNKKNSNSKNFNHKEKVPFMIYTDFECLLKPTETNDQFLQKHEAHSVSFFLHCSYDSSLSRYESYRQKTQTDPSPAAWFVNKLAEIKDKLEGIHPP